MNRQGLNKARVFLKKIGAISNRLHAREQARIALRKHIEKIQKRPTKTGLEKLPNLIQAAVQRETDLARNNLLETDRVKQLKDVIALLTKKNMLIEDEIAVLKGELSNQTSRPIVKKKKVSAQEKIVYLKKIKLLENKLVSLSKNKNVKSEQLSMIKNRIKRLKASL